MLNIFYVKTIGHERGPRNEVREVILFRMEIWGNF